MANEVTFLTSNNQSVLTTGLAKSGTNINSTLFIGYDSNKNAIPTVFADDISWSIKSADGKTTYVSTSIGDTPITTTEDLLRYIATLATTSSVEDGIRANDSMVYKGVIAGGTEKSTAYTPKAVTGDTYKVSSAGYINGVYCEVGDMLICLTDTAAAAASAVSASDDTARVTATTANGNWNFILTNLTLSNLDIYSGTDTSTAVISYNTSAEKKIQFTNGLKAEMSNSILLIGHSTSVTTSDSTAAIYKFKYDSYGHISSVNSWDPNTINIYNSGSAITGAVAYDPDSTTAITLNYNGGIAASYSGGIYSITNTGLRGVTDATSGDGVITFDVNGTSTDITVYTLPTATTTVLGGVKPLSADTSNEWSIISSGTPTANSYKTNALSTIADRYYAVLVDKVGHMFVNVPWKDNDVDVSASFSSTNGFEIAKFGPTGNLDSVYVPYATSSLSGTVKVGGTISSTAGYDAVMTYNGVAYAKTNTWRNIYAWNKSELGTTGDTIDEMVGTSIETAALSFSSAFAFTTETITVGSSSKTVALIDLVWAEVDSSGNITYVS